MAELLHDAGLGLHALGELRRLLQSELNQGLLLIEGPRWRLSDPAGLALSNTVLVTADLLGLTPRQPPFARAQLNLRQQALAVLQQWVAAQRAPTTAAASRAPHCSEPAPPDR